MKSEMDMDIKELRDELIQLRKDFAKLTDTLEATAKHGAAEAKEKVRETVSGLRGEAEDAAERLSHKIEANPIQGALSAFGIGVVLGLLLSPRR
jgi:ElaB/YqjD/DUF883 family membrane-anchored ribosome-binding protein